MKSRKKLTAVALATVMALSYADYPVYAKEGDSISLSDTQNTADEAVQNVKDKIASLPAVTEVQEMSQSERDEAYRNTQDVYDVYNALNDEQKAQMDASRLTELLDYFNGQVAETAGTSQKTEDSVAEVVMNNGSTTYYDSLNEAVETVSEAGGTATIAILKDTSYTSMRISSGNITLIGDNHTLTRASGTGITVEGGTLTIISCNIPDDVNGISCWGGVLNFYSGSAQHIVSYGPGQNANGTVNIYGGTFGSVHSYWGGAVYYIPNSITMNESSLSMEIGSYHQLVAQVNQNSIVVGGNNITIGPAWSSDNQSVATVDSSGYVTAVAPGTATITASAGGKSSTCTVTVKNESTLSITSTTEEMSKEYNGQAVSTPNVNTNRDRSDITFTWQQKNGEEWTDLSSAPVSAGSYRVIASVEANDNYTEASDSLEFSISQATNDWTSPLSIADWTYGQTASTPTATAEYGNVVFTYSASENGTFSTDVPTEAGTWYVKATVTGNADYTGLEAVTDFEIEKADSTISFNQGVSLNKEYNGEAVEISTDDVTKAGSANDVTFSWQQKDGEEWTDLSSAPVRVGSYRVVASVEEDRNFKGASATLEFSISQTTNDWTSPLSIDDWTYGQAASTPTATAKYGNVVFTYSDSENGTFSTDVPTEAGTWYVKATVTGNADYTGLEAVTDFEIEKADSTISFNQGVSLNKEYNGEAVEISTDDVTKAGSTNDVTFSWQQKDGDDWIDLASVPVSVGNYRVVASVEEDRNFKGASATLEFSISQTTNDWTSPLSIDDWTYGQTASTPTATAKYGDVMFTYCDSENGTFSTDVPTEAGTWYVKATVTGNADYTGLEAVTDFEIEKALPTYEVPTGLTIKQGEVLSSLALPDGFTWTDEEQTADTLGSQTFTALFTPEDTDNYQTVEVDITVEVLPALTPLNQIPAISAEDKTLTVGDTFDPLSGVTATDTEDGDLTDKIEVIHNSVDTTQAGTYEVTYKVTDSNGASSTKTITVTVKDKENTQGSPDNDTNKGNTDKTASSDDKQASVETGDSMNLVVWTALMLVSALGAVLSILFRRRTQR